MKVNAPHHWPNGGSSSTAADRGRGLELWLKQAGRVPLLTAAEEVHPRRMVRADLQLVASVAKKYRGGASAQSGEDPAPLLHSC